MSKITYLIFLVFIQASEILAGLEYLVREVNNIFEKQSTFSTHHDEIRELQDFVDFPIFAANICGVEQLYLGPDIKCSNYDSFLFHLALERKRFLNFLGTEIAYGHDNSSFSISQKLESSMSFTTFVNYHFTLENLKIISISIDGGCSNEINESLVKDTWIPKKDTSSIEEGEEYMRNVSRNLPFRDLIDDSLFRVNMFTHDFSALIDTNYDITYSSSVDFVKYMRRFNERYKTKEIGSIGYFGKMLECGSFETLNGNDPNITIITQSSDHIVFRTRIPLRYMNMLNFENWDFQIEIVYDRNNLKQWKIAKIFMRSEHFKNMAEIQKRAADELFIGIREEIQRLSRYGEITTFNSNWMGRVESLEVCENFKGPDSGLSLKFFNRSEATLFEFMYTTSSVTHGDPAQLDMNIFFEIKFVMKVVPTTFIISYDDYEDEYYIKSVSIPCSRDHTDEVDKNWEDESNVKKYGEICKKDNWVVGCLQERRFFDDFSEKLRVLLPLISIRSGSRKLTNFENLLHFNIISNNDKIFEIGYFILHLALRGKRYIDASIVDHRSTISEFTGNIIILNLTSLMNYTRLVKYEYKLKFDEKGSLKIYSMNILEMEVMSNWISKLDEKPRISADEVIHTITSNFAMLESNETLFNLNYSQNFMALIDTNYNFIYNSADFAKYMRKFIERYNTRVNYTYDYIVRDVDHIVIQYNGTFNYEDLDVEVWNFDIESTYIDDQWQITRIFMKSPYDDFTVIQQRSAQKLVSDIEFRMKNELDLTQKDTNITVCKKLDYIHIPYDYLRQTIAFLGEKPNIVFEFSLIPLKLVEIVFGLVYDEKFDFYSNPDVFVGCSKERRFYRRPINGNSKILYVYDADDVYKTIYVYSIPGSDYVLDSIENASKY